MNCKEVLSRLQVYVDGEMPAGLMREMDKHLDVCPSCRGQVERIRAVGNILGSLSVPPLPEGFSARVMAEARRRAPVAEKRKSFFPMDWQPLRWLLDLSVPMRLAASTVVLLACLLGMFMSRELSLSGNQRTSVAETESLDGFEWFSPTPPTSLGSAYITLAQAGELANRRNHE
ncbi:MAG TPA: zf-HC2 domain-containing protein [Syntrophobacteraceae bacterium]|nr:zf-HC2 domain-containing protein [Syntrophobacteraceae bacterium]